MGECVVNEERIKADSNSIAPMISTVWKQRFPCFCRQALASNCPIYAFQEIGAGWLATHDEIPCQDVARITIHHHNETQSATRHISHAFGRLNPDGEDDVRFMLICLYRFERGLHPHLRQWRRASLGAVSADLPELEQRNPLMVVCKEPMYVSIETNPSLALNAERPI